jgi:hypothetical protein
LGWILFRSFTYPETATRGGGFFEVLRDGRGQRVADTDLVADAGGGFRVRERDDELLGLDECFQVLGRIGAELELAGVEVPDEKDRGLASFFFPLST